MRIPHTLRFVVLLLRVALGLNLFYYGAGKIFAPSFGGGPVAPFINFSAAADASFGGTTLPALFWPTIAFIIGICLIIGFLTRIASVVGIILAAVNYAPFGGTIPVTPLQFANNVTLVALCFLVIIFANAGEYFGLDRFIHLSLSKKQRQ